jgi:flagellar hook assembly protein FlgD
VKPAGVNQLIWNGKDSNGIDIPSGIYFIKLKTERAELTKKITLLK